VSKRLSCCIIVYGCAKNQVDAEEMASRLKKAGFSLTGEPAEADLIIVHTCGFIESAKRESIEGILEACQIARRKGTLSGDKPLVLVTGCLAQRYPKELLKEIPEISGIAGTMSPRDIVGIANEVLSGRKVVRVGQPGRGAPGRSDLRLLDTGLPWAYLRVSEGCRHHCTYCTIPSMRGPLSSRPKEDIIAEARLLSEAGIKELNLIAQDLSDYGVDLYGKRCLAGLVRDLADVGGIEWIRLLYVRPDGVTDELVDAMTHPKVVPYIDLPMEHGSAKILKLMGRPGPQKILETVTKLRHKVPNIAIRTSIIAGFPGETDEDVEKTIELLTEAKVHRVGVFPYSKEEKTPAYNLPGTVPEKVKRERAEVIRRFGLQLAKMHSQSLLGKDIPLLLIQPSTRKGYWLARAPHQAPEVDGKVYVKAEGNVGHIVTARVTTAGYLDLWARTS